MLINLQKKKKSKKSKQFNLNGKLTKEKSNFDSVGPKWFMGQAHLPGQNPKAQAEEGYGPNSTR